MHRHDAFEAAPAGATLLSMHGSSRTPSGQKWFGRQGLQEVSAAGVLSPSSRRKPASQTQLAIPYEPAGDCAFAGQAWHRFSTKGAASSG
jgi:hypothetical protein